MTISATTFQQLMERGHRVRVPRNQRDYAHGRSALEATEIRKRLLASIGAVLGSDDAPSLELGVIYLQNEILVDGQQRLTTLFLLHWYLAREHLPWMANFSYDTRLSARDFCHALATHPCPMATCVVKEQVWFQAEWAKDPTVAGCLAMLDAICAEFPTSQQHNLMWQRLKRITFTVRSLDGVGDDGEIYLKLNDRGVQLTPFETWKTWFVREAGLVEDVDYQRKLDNEWADLFWSSKATPESVDDAMLAFLKGVALNHRISATRASDEHQFVAKVHSGQSMTDTDLAVLFDTAAQRIAKDPTSSSKTTQLSAVLSDTAAQRIAEVLDFLSADGKLDALAEDFAEAKTGQHSAQYTNFVKCAVNGWSNCDYGHRVLSHALFIMLLRGQEAGASTPAQWMRMVRNLVINAELDAENLGPAIRGIDELWQRITTTSTKLPGGPWTAQMKEELKKWELVKRDPAWAPLLIQAEDHPFFRGQIGFLLNMADGDREGFRRLSSAACEIFTTERVWQYPFELQRAALCFGDVVGWVKSNNYTLGRSRDDWRLKLLAHEENQKPIHQLLEAWAESPCFQEIIACREANLPHDWRLLLVKYPDAIAACEQGMLSFVADSADNVRLLESTDGKSTQRELRSYCFYLDRKQDGWEHVTGRGLSSLPSAQRTGNDPNQRIQVLYRQSQNPQCPWQVRSGKVGTDTSKWQNHWFEDIKSVEDEVARLLGVQTAKE